MTPAFAQASVFCRLATRATISPSPSSVWYTKRNWSVVFQMSTPAPETEKVPDAWVACPASAGVPMSWDTQGAGKADVLTVKVTLLLATPPTVTTTAPVVAPVGTGTTMLPAVQEVGVATVPLTRTLLVPCVDPKFVPLIVTGVPTDPDVGDRFEMFGVGVTSVTVQVKVLLFESAPSDAVAVAV
jgi:hypothetical protein